jgi:hypothetical protein
MTSINFNQIAFNQIAQQTRDALVRLEATMEKMSDFDFSTPLLDVLKGIDGQVRTFTFQTFQSANREAKRQLIAGNGVWTSYDIHPETGQVWHCVTVQFEVTA